LPEMPEVETIRRSLAPRIEGKTITAVYIFSPKFIRNTDPETFTRTVEGKGLKALNRRGKYLIFVLSTGDMFLIHLRMAGRLLYCSASQERNKHTHVVFCLDGNDPTQLRFIDLRHFGGIYLVRKGRDLPPEGFRNLGPEILAPEFTLAYLETVLKKKKARIKSLLLDQSLLAGLGNIYADEVLHEAGINPMRPGGSLSFEEIHRLYGVIQRVIREAVRERGTTFATYVDGEGKAGNYASRLKVYQRQGESCLRCGTPVERLKIGSRSSYFCPRCQV